MPTVFIPTTFIGYTPTGIVNSPLQFTTSTGATLSFPNLYADIKGIPWLFGGTAWAGTRYYKRESVYISDFFYWNPSGVGAGIEDINLGKDLRFSYAAFAVDGRLAPGAAACSRRRWRCSPTSAFETICSFAGSSSGTAANSSSGSSTSRTTATTPPRTAGGASPFRFVQKLLGGDNKFVFQYGRGAGTGFGTLARYLLPRLLALQRAQRVPDPLRRRAHHSARRDWLAPSWAWYSNVTIWVTPGRGRTGTPRARA